MTAKSKILYGIGGLFIAVISFVTLISFFSFKHASVDDYTQNLHDNSFLVSSAIEQRMNRTFDVLTVISNQLAIDQKDFNVKQAITTLTSVSDNLDVINAYMATADGATYSTSSNGLVANFNAKTKGREWFKRAFAGDEKILTKPYTSAEGDAVMAAAVPIKQNGKVIGVLCVNLDISHLTRFIAGLTDNNQIYVTNMDGYILAANDGELLGQNLGEVIPSYQEHQTQKSSQHSYFHNGLEHFVVSSKIDILGWTTWAWDDWKNINHASNQNLILTLVISSILTIATLLIAYFLINKVMYLPIGGEPDRIETIVNRIASGDLNQLEKPSGKETGVYAAVLQMADKLRNTISNINETSQQLDVSSKSILESASNVMKSSELQMTQLESTSSAMYQMSNTVKEVANNALEASKATSAANQHSDEGKLTVLQVNESISKLVTGIGESQKVVKQLETEAEGIGNILNVIGDIAEQTNLLALNAAIEAARAGEQGRGFAVVADEVRNLASRTQESTGQIQTLIQKLQGAVTSSVELMQTSCDDAQLSLTKSLEATQALEAIQSSVGIIHDMNNQIATAAEQQTQVAGEISTNVTGIHDLARNTFDNSENNTKVAGDLSQSVAKLNRSVELFKI